MLPTYYYPQDTDLSYTPISQQLVYPRRTDPVLDYYPQPLFPTPSELLSNITNPPDSRVYSPPPPQTSRHQSPDPDTAAAPAVNKSESQRKARQRAIAEEIGFTPTDP